jgi:hypothetical protein
MNWLGKRMTRAELSNIASSIRRERKSGSLRQFSPEAFAQLAWPWVVAICWEDSNDSWFAAQIGLEYDAYRKVWVEAQPILTAKEHLVNMLVQHALSPIQAEEITTSVLDTSTTDWKIWNSPSDKQLPEFYAEWWLVARQAALEWIDKCIPGAWFRPMFVKDEQC